MSAVQPCDFSSSPVSSNSFVFSQPTTAPPPLVHSVRFASSANIRWCVPKHVLMCVSFFVFGSYIASWRPERLTGNSFADGCVDPALQNAGLSAGRIVDVIQTRPLLVEHRIVDVVLARPERFVAPIGRRCARIRPRRRLGRRIAHGERNAADRVAHRVEHREIVAAQLERAVEQSVRVERRVAPVRRDDVVEIRLGIRPVPLGDDDVALESLRTLRRGRRDLARRDAVGPVGEQRERARLSEIVDRREHLRSRLSRLHASLPRGGARLDLAVGRRQLARPLAAELMARHARAGLDRSDPIALRLHIG